MARTEMTETARTAYDRMVKEAEAMESRAIEAHVAGDHAGFLVLRRLALALERAAYTFAERLEDRQRFDNSLFMRENAPNDALEKPVGGGA